MTRCLRKFSVGLNHVYVIGLLLCWPSSSGCHALQAGGGVRIVRGRKTPTPVPSNRGRGHMKARVKGGKNRAGGGAAGGGACSSRGMPPADRVLDPPGPALGSNHRVGGSGQRKKMKKGTTTSTATCSTRLMARLRREVKDDARNVPDVAKMLEDGLPYLTRSEATEVQLALAVSIYAHSKTITSNSSSTVQDDDRVKAGVEVCLELGRLGMGRDALLAAILGGVLRPETSKHHSTPPGFGRAPVTVVDIRNGFGKNVARLVAGLEHVTRVEETAHAVLTYTGDGSDEILSGITTSANAERGGRGREVDQGQDEDEPLSPAMLIGARERLPGEAGGWRGRGRGRTARCLRDASAFEQAESLRNLLLSEAEWQVLTLRLAVQLQVLRRSTGDVNSANYKQLARDVLLVYGPLAHRLGIHQLRNELETVAFRRLFPAQFNKVRQATMDRSPVYEKVAEATTATLRQALRDTPAFTNQLAGEFILQHRIKSPFSMWKKMEKNQVSVEGVFDAVAIRVVLEARRWQGESLESHTQRSEDLCYQAMSVIQKLYPWSQSQQRFKDYIAKPKPNGYQSLHATQLVPDVTDMTGHSPSIAIEFQVRSKEMHHKAEFGLAAHWSYKEPSHSGSLGWIRDIGDKTTNKTSQTHPHKALGRARVPDSVTSGPELVDWLHRELRKRKVFVFGPDKKIWELDKGSATAGDVLGRSYMQKFYEGSLLHDRKRIKLDAKEPYSVKRTRIALVNGREVDSSYPLKNGDVFDVGQA